jgi:hypothetical protein
VLLKKVVYFDQKNWGNVVKKAICSKESVFFKKCISLLTELSYLKFIKKLFSRTPFEK